MISISSEEELRLANPVAHVHINDKIRPEVKHKSAHLIANFFFVFKYPFMVKKTSTSHAEPKSENFLGAHALPRVLRAPKIIGIIQKKMQNFVF